MKKIKIQLLEKEIPAADATVTINEELDRDYKYLTGIAFPSNIGSDGVLKSSSVDGSELLPKNFEVINLQSSTAVAPDERFFSVRADACGNKIELVFMDADEVPTYPYTLQIRVRLENE